MKMTISKDGMEALRELPGTLYVSKPYGQETEYGLGFEQCEKLYSEKLKAILERFIIQGEAECMHEQIRELPGEGQICIKCGQFFEGQTDR